MSIDGQIVMSAVTEKGLLTTFKNRNTDLRKVMNCFFLISRKGVVSNVLFSLVKET